MLAVADPTQFTLSLAEAATRSGYNERHLRRLKDAGRLPAAKLKGALRFRPEDVEALTRPRIADAEAEHEQLVAAIVAAAPAFSPARRAAIEAALRGAERQAATRT